MRSSRLTILCMLLCIVNVSNAQWKISVNKLQRNVVEDLLPASRYTFVDGLTFFGPAFSLEENVIRKGVPIPSEGLTFNLKAPVLNGVLLLNAKLDQPAKCTITLRDSLQQAFTYEWNCTLPGYQLPIEIPFEQFKLQNKSPQNIVSVHIVARSSKNGGYPHVILGQCKVLQHNIVNEPARGIFFYDITRKPAQQLASYNWKVGDSYPMSTFTMYRDVYTQAYVFETTKPTTDSNFLQKQILSLLTSVLKQYVYYKEHQLSSTIALAKMKEISQRNVAFSGKINSVDSLMRSFHDGHFYIERKQPNTLNGPVHVRKIGEAFIVIGVFNAALAQSIQVGDTVLSIDGHLPEVAITQANGRFYGDEQTRYQQAVQRMLFKPASDSTRLIIIQNGETKQVTYAQNMQVTVPPSFRPVHRAHWTKNNVTYWRLNKWDLGEWLMMYNEKEQLTNSQSIIFDLRGNTGGLELEAFRIVASFIDQPIVANISEYTAANGKHLQAPITLQPCKYLQLKDKEVVVLVDHQTACASEVFALLMRKHAHAKIIGTSKTAGSYASGESFILPYDITVRVNMLNKFRPADPHDVVEYRGLYPDLLVPLETWEDFFPYNDKLLTTALARLQQL
ncbi:peptidase S41-like protein [Chitinophaga skermanii]|uniref:Peptidase S41-like protein n=1 Tax=Chitinophaga skermanii TaxID=331697 RepID=A0A327QUP0_9BACT|nr:S41 family peptidase [Chitinophaga skermanii]RAJ08329.1 peptidase S41-like protein [Chitinophaga skermanii]